MLADSHKLEKGLYCMLAEVGHYWNLNKPQPSSVIDSDKSSK